MSLARFVIGCVLLFAYLRRWTTTLAVTPDHLAFWTVLGVASVGWELRRGSLGLGANWGLAAALPAAILTSLLAGDGVLFTLPLWATAVLLLPGLPYAVADARAKRSGPSADEVAVGLPGQ
ncbi:hypothetical protein OG730_00955 [Streptomyces sp. NBC_01298]|uniref:hypothetical protein n=1 Tax=Streptomyces sp. NBC_01298 TaxID=2903817 RepID=UPI002E10C1B2|nr:hypothetical protein OG730_00955 [Streptomyces sp. NBC_01298]